MQPSDRQTAQFAEVMLEPGCEATAGQGNAVPAPRVQGAHHEHVFLDQERGPTACSPT